MQPTNKMIIRNGVVNHAENAYYAGDEQLKLTLDLDYFDIKTPIDIYCSIRKFKDLDLLYSACAALRRHDRVINHINFNYLFGMRSDRSFELGMPNYFRDVVAPLVNHLLMDFDVTDSSIRFPHGTLAHNYLPHTKEYTIHISRPNSIIIFADSSAAKNWHDYYDLFGSWQNSIWLDKVRQPGSDMMISISKENMQKITIAIDEEPRPLLIFDDLCDGGTTFKYASDLFTNLGFINHKKHLFVAHVLREQPLLDLLDYYDKIIITNSCEAPVHERIEIIDVWGK